MDDIFERLYISFMGQKMPAERAFAPTEAQAAEARLLFGLLQRREEYAPARPDARGRFRPEDSAQFLAGRHTVPVVDGFFDTLFPGAYAARYAYQCIPTFDIDNAYAFRAKGWTRNAGGMAKNILSDRRRARARLSVWRGGLDPYDTYGYIVDTCRSLGMRPLFFIQMGNYRNGVDTNIRFTDPAGRRLLEFLSAHGEVGLHPSVASNADADLLKREHGELSGMLGRAVTQSRQHFLMLHFPQTYRRLADLGIREDYSMGWSSQVGFRAGTSRPFLWYDLEREGFGELTVYPFGAMDGTLHEYLRLDPEAATRTVQPLITQTRMHQGVYTPLWHNHSVNDRWEWAGWQSVFEEMLAFACP